MKRISFTTTVLTNFKHSTIDIAVLEWRMKF